jgi:hypothetical protein
MATVWMVCSQLRTVTTVSFMPTIPTENGSYGRNPCLGTHGNGVLCDDFRFSVFRDVADESKFEIPNSIPCSIPLDLSVICPFCCCGCFFCTSRIASFRLRNQSSIPKNEIARTHALARLPKCAPKVL